MHYFLSIQSILRLIISVYKISYFHFYRPNLLTKVSQVRTDIQFEFMDMKIMNPRMKKTKFF